MLNINEIKFPITFDTGLAGKVTFANAQDKGVWSNGEESDFKLSYFVKQHNHYNMHNKPGLRYHYEMQEAVREQNDQVDALQYLLSPTGECYLKNAFIQSGTVAVNTDMICAIEEMPVGATILAIKRNAEGWDDVTFTPRRIEVHDDTITLLSGYAGFNGHASYSLELSIKRGTKVKYRTNC